MTLLNPDFWSFVGVIAGIYTIFALGLQVQYGFAGLLNFGHVASMALAAYTMAILVVKANMSLWLAAPIGIAVAMAGFLLVGLTTPRLRADYFAIVTIAFSEIIRYIAINQQDLTGGPQGTIALGATGQAAEYNTQWNSFIGGVQSRLESVSGKVVNRDVAMMIVVWLVALLLLAVTQRALKTPWGRTLRTVREDEEAAVALGKNAFGRKLQALAVGAALGGCAGLFYAFEFSFFSPGDFDPLTTFFAWIIVILGGTARVWAVPVGSLVFGFLFAGTRFFDFWPFSTFGSADRAYIRLIVIGLLLIGLMYFRPQGLLGKREELVLE
jgi:branched-chain amino acid transport system permease protein